MPNRLDNRAVLCDSPFFSEPRVGMNPDDEAWRVDLFDIGQLVGWIGEYSVKDRV